MPPKLSWENTEDGQEVELDKGSQHFENEDGFIQNGIIAINGVKVGDAVADFMYGYHPAIRVRVGTKTTYWLEFDEEDLYLKILNYAKENT